jgi:hypothetical protein
MGRWAQQRRRGGSPPGEGITPVVPLNVLAFNWNGGAAQYDLVFDGPITYSGVNTLGGCQVDAEDPDIVTPTGVDRLQLHFPTAAGPGTTWGLNSQPPEIAEPINVPGSGTTT